MKLIKIQFTAWRDAPGQVVASTEVDAANDKVAALEARRRQQFAEAERTKGLINLLSEADVKSRVAVAVAEIDNIDDALKAARSAQDAAGAAAMVEAGNHRRAKSVGYQILNDTGTELTALVDDAGQPLPEGAVYEYQVVDVNPKLPDWAIAADAQAGKVDQ